jgi:hypothetical protein
MTTATAKHRISWWVYAGSEKIRHTARMRGTWGYDVTCSCGWETRTGGAVRRHIKDEIYLHKLSHR